MYLDGRSIPQDENIETDVCIIGAGAAGITLANEFIEAPFRTALIESGGFEYGDRTQNLYKGTVTGHYYPPLDGMRMRIFGGSTGLWGGHCLPMRDINFEPCSWIPYSGWPMSVEQLQPYYRRAHNIIGLGAFDYDPVAMAGRFGQRLLPFDRSRIPTVVSRYNPVNFGRRYRHTIGNAPNITTYLDSNVVSINRSADKDVVNDVTIRTLEGNRYRIRAKYFILATGGIENARLLLLSSDVQQAGLGNQNDLVGRFFMEHIWYVSGYLIPTSQHYGYDLYTHLKPLEDNITIKALLAVPESILRREQIADFRVELGLWRDRKLNIDSTASDSIPENPPADSAGEYLGPHILKIMDSIQSTGDRPGYLRGLLKYQLGYFLEQVPNPHSRITLAEEKDALGYRRASLNWQLTEIERATILRARHLIALETGRSGLGRLKAEFPEENPDPLKSAHGSGHHMGTTRMGNDPKTSVVDRQCLMHDLQNLYVAGSSVFPTGGFANPTLTIVALAIRLADHIKAKHFA